MWRSVAHIKAGSLPGLAVTMNLKVSHVYERESFRPQVFFVLFRNSYRNVEVHLRMLVCGKVQRTSCEWQ